MTKIEFKNLPDTTTPLNAQNLNQLQDNVEDAIPTIDSSVSTSSTNGVENQAITNYVDNEISNVNEQIANINMASRSYVYSGNVDGEPAQSGWVDTLQKSYTFTGLTPNKNYLIIWSCSWVRNNATESSATSGECKWKTNNGGFTNGVMTAPANVNQTFTCFGYGTSDASGNLTVNLYSNSGGAWAGKTPYFSGLNVIVFGI